MKYINSTVKSYLNELASDAPVPGGGGTSALVAALAAALGLMVSGIIHKRLKKNSDRVRLRHLILCLRRSRRYFERVIDRDPRVYASVMGAYRSARAISNRGRAHALIDRALTKSFQEQHRLAIEIAQTKKYINRLSKIATGSIGNDLRVAAALLEGAWRGAFYTARINVDYIQDAKRKRTLTALLRRTPKI